MKSQLIFSQLLTEIPPLSYASVYYVSRLYRGSIKAVLCRTAFLTLSWNFSLAPFHPLTTVEGDFNAAPSFYN